MQINIIRLVVLAAIAGGLIGVVAATTGPTRVRAASCPTSGDTNTDARDGDRNPAGFLENHRGDRSLSMWVADTAGTVTCARVSSLIIDGGTAAEGVEAGWFDASGEDGCAYTGSGPRELWFAMINNHPYCATQTPTAITGGEYDSFSVWDPADDYNWDFGHNGTTFKTLTDGNLADGWQFSNGERHNAADTPWSHFEQLQFENNTGWHNWDGTTPDPNNDDNSFCANILSATEVRVQADPC